jgi:methionyl-tRNA formyltransferase
MEISLFLMSKKGLHVLNSLIINNYSNLISLVVIARDKNVTNDYADELIQICTKNNINFIEKNELLEIKTKYVITISWRWIINVNKETQLIVLHDSLLPKYRGFAPLVNMLINNEKKIGVTAIFASEEYDKGDIILQSSTDINYPIKISDAIEILNENYSKIVLEIFKSIKHQKVIEGKKQNEEFATYSLWRDEEDYLIDWNLNSFEIINFINALSSPYKGASTYLNGKIKARILDAEIVDDVKIENRVPGKIIFILDNKPIIVCGSGLIKINSLIEDSTLTNLLPLKNFRTKMSSKIY